MSVAAIPGLAGRTVAVLVSPPLLLSLALLLSNDRWLKHAYPGVLTGKLSDFAGIALVGVLLAASFPRHRRATLIGLSIAFAWWKSPFSQPAIDWLSSVSGIAFARVVDYTDLMALSVLPPCAAAANRACERAPDLRALRRAASVPVGLVAALAIMGTSAAMAHRDYDLRPASAHTPIDAASVKRVVDDVATRNGMRWVSPLDNPGTVHYEGHGLWLDYHLDESRGIRFNVAAAMDGMFFGTRAEKRADDLRQELKNAFAEQIPGLEYVEPLVAQHPPRPPCNQSPVPTPPCR